MAAAVTADPRVQQAERATIQAQQDADRAAALFNAFEHRRSMLNNEVTLWTSNYWGDVEGRKERMAPTARKAEATEAAEEEERVEAARANVRERKRRRPPSES